MVKARLLQWGALLLIVLAAFARWCVNAEGSGILDVTIVSQQELEELCNGKQYIQNPENVQELIFFQDNAIPYDTETNTFYIVQNMDTEEYEGSLTAADGVKLYFDESATAAKTSLMENGGNLTLWVVTDKRYTLCTVVCTGLPVWSLETEDGISLTYGSGKAMLWEPYEEELDTIAVKSSDSLLKKSESGETVSIKFRKKDCTKNHKLSLLSSEKYDAWKLYQISEKDKTFIRSMLAYQLWNQFDSTGLLQRNCYLVELVEDGSYRGLFLLLPRVDDDYFDESEVSVTQTEEDSANFSDIDTDNLTDYYLFLQAVCAHENISSGQYIVSMEDTSYLMPEKIEYCMGIFPNRLEYLGYRSQERMIPASDLLVPVAEEFSQNASVCWFRARETFLTDDAITADVSELGTYLVKSGFIARYIAGIDPTLNYQTQLDELSAYLAERMLEVDEYYRQTD